MTPKNEARKALETAREDFEAIRLTLVNILGEPGRTAFWRAVSARKRVEDALAAPQVEQPVVFHVHDFHVARQPVKARGKFEEPTEYFYPASREGHARDTARIMGGTCTPLYAAPVSAPSSAPSHEGVVEALKVSARKAIDAGEEIIKTLTRERDEARAALAALPAASPGVTEATPSKPGTELRERLALKFIANCKCGNCQYVPVELIARSADALDLLEAEKERLQEELTRYHSDLPFVIGWNEGFEHATKEDLKFPTMLRKMWSGGEVQKWLDEQFAARRALAAGERT